MSKQMEGRVGGGRREVNVFFSSRRAARFGVHKPIHTRAKEGGAKMICMDFSIFVLYYKKGQITEEDKKDKKNN